MRKFINNPDSITDEMLEGFQLSMEEFIDIQGHIVIRKNFNHESPKVTTVTLGGSGHEPSSFGFFGRGWECIKVIGEIFAAPGHLAVLEGIKLADKGEGVLLYVGNHSGDIMSAKMAKLMAEKQGIDIEMIIFYDDISSFSRNEKEQRRGMIAGLGLGKILGAACEKEYDLYAVKEIGERFRDNSATLSVSTFGATHPVTGRSLSNILDGSMIIGMGQHGEGNFDTMPMLTSKETVRIIIDRIVEDLKLVKDEKILVILNGSGSTTYGELMILYRDTIQYLKTLKMEVAGNLVGEFLTTQEQAGFQLCIVRMDDELIELFHAPCRTAFKTIE